MKSCEDLQQRAEPVRDDVDGSIGVVYVGKDVRRVARASWRRSVPSEPVQKKSAGFTVRASVQSDLRDRTTLEHNVEQGDEVHRDEDRHASVETPDEFLHMSGDAYQHESDAALDHDD